jgi:hypothetical protein
MTLGTASGSYAFRAELAGQPNVSSSVGATATADVATQLLILQQPATAAQATIAFKQQPKVQLADRFGNPVRLTGVVISAVAQSVCGLRCAVGAASIQPPTVVMRAVISADTITRGLVGTTSVTTDGEGVATFTDLALNELVGDWLLVFMDRNESLASATSSFIALGAGPPRSIVKASADTSSVLPGAVISPLARVIDAVGNGVENVTVSWDNKQGTQGTLDNTVTRTDASGFTGPGQWTVPLTQTLGLTYTIVASTPGLNLENSLAFYAIITQLLP